MLQRGAIENDEEIGELVYEAPEIPETRPAMVQPEWREGILVLPNRPATYDKGTEIVDALKALKDDLEELASDIAAEGNIDQRVRTFLGRLAERVPQSEPTQYQIHRLGLAESNLATYLQTTIVYEWPDFLAARMLGAMKQFDRVMGQFPSWRRFKQNAEQDVVSKDALKEIADKVEVIATALDEYRQGIVDSRIPTAMHAQVSDIRALEDEGLEFNKALIAYDAREGARNTGKEILGKLVDWTKPGFDKAHKESGDAIGGLGYRLLWAVAIAFGLGTAASLNGMSLSELAALIEKSPDALKFLEGKEGWLAALLVYLANMGSKK